MFRKTLPSLRSSKPLLGILKLARSRNAMRSSELKSALKHVGQYAGRLEAPAANRLYSRIRTTQDKLGVRSSAAAKKKIRQLENLLIGVRGLTEPPIDGSNRVPAAAAPQAVPQLWGELRQAIHDERIQAAKRRALAKQPPSDVSLEQKTRKPLSLGRIWRNAFPETHLRHLRHGG